MRKLLWLPDEETPEFITKSKLEKPDWWSLMAEIRASALKKAILPPPRLVRKQLPEGKLK
jgi:hypothetical protein